MDTAAGEQPPETRATGSTIQALHRGLLVLEALASESGDVSLSQLSARFPWHKSTTLRLLNTLIQHGHAEQDPETQRYRLGLEILRLSGALNRRLSLRDRARGPLRQLAATTRETAHVAVLDRGEAVVLEQAETVERIRLITYVGMRMPCYCTALGKVLAAHLSVTQLDELLQSVQLQSFTERTMVDPDALRRHLAEVRASGLARDVEEYDAGMTCLAAPVRDKDGRVIAAVGISGPSGRMRAQDHQGAGDAVVEAARSISARLGYREESQDDAGRRAAEPELASV